MIITERQTKILEEIVENYIKLAQPISSEFLEKKLTIGISAATLRIEMHQLTKQGYLYQPHRSAGRIPTDKGYRFFVNRIFETGFSDLNNERLVKEIQQIEDKMEDIFKFSQEITKILASLSSGLALTYLFEEDLVWKEGWNEVFSKPEFKNFNYLKKFLEIVDKFEENIKNFVLKNSEILVFIGRENPIKRAKDFSFLICQGKFPKQKKGALALLGPKRMDYNKNISLINSIIKLLSVM